LESGPDLFLHRGRDRVLGADEVSGNQGQRTPRLTGHSLHDARQAGGGHLRSPCFSNAHGFPFRLAARLLIGVPAFPAERGLDPAVAGRTAASAASVRTPSHLPTLKSKSPNQFLGRANVRPAGITDEIADENNLRALDRRIAAIAGADLDDVVRVDEQDVRRARRQKPEQVHQLPPSVSVNRTRTASWCLHTTFLYVASGHVQLSMEVA